MRVYYNGNVGIGDIQDPDALLHISQSANVQAVNIQLNKESNAYALNFRAWNGSYSTNLINCNVDRTSSAFNFLRFFDTESDGPVTNFRGDGVVYSDGAYNSSGGQDYSEYFEVALTEHTASGIPVGVSVALTGSKVIPASQSNSEPIGVTRPTGSSAFVAGAAHMGWHDRWLTDDFGEKLVDENGNYQYNPEYSASLAVSGSYIPREDRAEWVIVGLLGQIPMIKGQQTGSSWSKMRDISNTVEMWFVK